MNWAEINDVGEMIKNGKRGKAEDAVWALPRFGAVRLKSAYFTYDSYTWKRIDADLLFNPARTDSTVNSAEICGVSTPGKIALTEDGLDLDFEPVARWILLFWI